MFRYYQVGEKSAWKAIPDTPDVEAQAQSAGAKKVTILSVSEIVDDESTEKENLSYKGPWYADIDNKDLNEAIKAAGELIHKLRRLDVPDEAIQVFASGSKGFHIIVPASVFSSNRPLKGLPSIYKEMALDLHVLGMDFQVYSAGRGVCWRLPNIQRDNGRYRVPVTIDEVLNMTPESYVTITSTPRILPAPSVDNLKSAGMEALMNEARKRVKRKPPQPPPVPASALVQFQSAAPQCIHNLADYKVKNGINFNESAMQMSIYLARSVSQEGLAASLQSRMAANGSSQTYYTPRQRLIHIQGLTNYLRTSAARQFSCAAMRSILTSNPCEGCPLAGSQTAMEEADINAEVAIEERPDGYYSGERKISTFTLRATDVYLETSQDGEVSRRLGVRAQFLRGGSVMDTHMVMEDGWISRNRFKSEIKGLRDSAFFGTDDDVQKIKFLVCNDLRQDMNEIVQVYAAGVHLHKVAGRELNVYVEPGFSINEVRIRNTHELCGHVSNPPALADRTVPPKRDAGADAELDHLLQMNTPFVMGQIIGWVSACHLKTQFMSRYNQFPLVNLWGNAGSGKSMTAVVSCLLGGCDYMAQGEGPKTLPSITKWAMIDVCSTTTTIPRILEEFNKSNMQPMYTFCAEIMKSAWNGQTVARGRIARSSTSGAGRTGAETVHIPILSPLLVISEQAVQIPALQQRMLQIALSHKDRHGLDKHFFYAKEHGEKLLDLAMALMVKSLTIHKDWLTDRMIHWDGQISTKLIERPRYSFQVALTGLDFLELVATELALKSAARIDILRKAVLLGVEQRAQIMTADRHRTEIDMVIAAFGTMASLTQQGGSRWLESGTHYLKTTEHLLIDIPVAHALYKLYMRHLGETPVIETIEQMQELLRQEYYFDTDNFVCAPLRLTRPVTQLNLARMQEKNINISMF